MKQNIGFDKQGSIYIVVGPSGVGKNTLINGVLEKLKNVPSCVVCPRRAITRLEKNSDEDHEVITDEYFELAEAKGLFGVIWSAYGYKYGIREKDIISNLENGINVVLNVSRSVIETIQEKYSKFKVIVVEISAPEDIVRQRLLARHRESLDSINDRILRNREQSERVHKISKNLVVIKNDDTIEIGVETLLILITKY